MPKIKTLTQLQKRLAKIAESPHETTGRWTAAQIFYHLAAAFEGSVEGLPPGYNVVARTLVAPVRWILTRVWFPAGIPIPAAIADKVAPPPEADLEEQYQRLLAVR
ncbi:DUF1569 domain-containing protein [Blastopirellula retiformator]|uniref:Uncharacterized protein n=1 Tax=Blastopirellula retiformator TaxID=2527970 RepID=A0A5C5V4I6_9BACT|nr:DUF1569 domain-containing protein [Blastopirellula retiformator]TWT32883.1 hypothetical protein Enr8_26900 [Blastopirellula retiformator]